MLNTVQLMMHVLLGLNWFQLRVNPSCLNVTQVQSCVMSKLSSTLFKTNVVIPFQSFTGLLFQFGYIRVIYRIQLLTKVNRVQFI